MIAKQIGGLLPGVAGGVRGNMGSMTAPVADRVTRSMNKTNNKGQMPTPPPKGNWLSRLPLIGGAFQFTSDVSQGKQTIMVIKAYKRYKESWNDIIANSSKSELRTNIYNFLNEKGIIEETKKIAKSYFNKSRLILKKLNHINTSELSQYVDLLEKRTY